MDDLVRTSLVVSTRATANSSQRLRPSRLRTSRRQSSCFNPRDHSQQLRHRNQRSRHSIISRTTKSVWLRVSTSATANQRSGSEPSLDGSALVSIHATATSDRDISPARSPASLARFQPTRPQPAIATRNECLLILDALSFQFARPQPAIATRTQSTFRHSSAPFQFARPQPAIATQEAQALARISHPFQFARPQPAIAACHRTFNPWWGCTFQFARPQPAIATRSHAEGFRRARRVSIRATAASDRDCQEREPLDRPATSFNPRDRGPITTPRSASNPWFQPARPPAIATPACSTRASTGSGTRRAITVPFQPTRPQPAITTCDRPGRLRQRSSVSTPMNAASEPTRPPLAVATCDRRPAGTRVADVSIRATAASVRDFSPLSSRRFQPPRSQPAIATSVSFATAARAAAFQPSRPQTAPRCAMTGSRRAADSVHCLFQPSRPQTAIATPSAVRVAAVVGMVSTLATADSDRDAQEGAEAGRWTPVSTLATADSDRNGACR